MLNLEKVCDKLWHIRFSTLSDLTMHFLRYNEANENPNFKGKDIEIIDFMSWYSEKYGKGSFTYARDYLGFNIPAKYIFDLHEKGILDLNRCDSLMLSICQFIKSKEGTTDFYLIGTSIEDEEEVATFNHELAHGLFYTNEIYKDKMTKMVSSMAPRTRGFLYKKLREYGYDEPLLIDETQAYLSTGLNSGLKTKGTVSESDKFSKIFKKFAGKHLKKDKKK